jgi:hypothetical protein
MLPFFWYILKVALCSGILFGYYWLFLRNKIFHQYNRFYLLAALMLSLLLPVLKIDFWQQNTNQSQVIKALQVVSAGDEYMSNVIITANKKDWSMQQLYPVVYWVVSFTFLFILLQTLFVIRSLLKRYPAQLIDKFSFVNTDDKSTPFSFLKYIFWNTNIDIDTVTGRQIFKHEVAHIQEKHTYDKLFVNIILIFFWCNPFFWLYRKELNMIHEFIADKKAVEDSDTASFAAMILQAAYPRHSFELTNNFFYSPIKRRLLMLTKNNNPKVNYIGRIMVLPLAVLVFAAFTLKTKNNKENVKSLLSIVALDTVPGKSKLSLLQQQGKDEGNPIPKMYYNGIEITKSVILKDQNVEITLINGEKMVITQQEAFKMGLFPPPPPPPGTKEDNNNRLVNKMITGLIVLNGEVKNKNFDVNTINPEAISSINVLKGESALKKYGAQGELGVVEIITKSPNDLAEVVVSGYPAKTETPVAIALDKMNVFYIGIDNPITIAVPNIPSDKLLVTINNGLIKGSNGKYIVRVATLGEATITVATIKDDRKVLLSTQTFRVKRIPDPVNGQVPVDFDLKYKIDSGLYQQKKNEMLLLEQQYKISKDLVEKTVVGKKLQDQELSNLNQKLVSEYQNKAHLYLADKKVAGKPLNDQELNNLNQKLLSEYRYKTQLYLADKTLNQVKLKNLQALTQQQKQALEQQNKLTLALVENKLLNNAKDSALMNVLLQQKEILAQQNNLVFTKVEVSPMFTGGDDAWRKYLIKNLKANTPVEEGWKSGKFTVIVKFIVHTDGTVSDVTTENYKGSKTAQHCIEVIKNAPKWQPAVQNGKKVNAWKKQPITFVIEE